MKVHPLDFKMKRQRLEIFVQVQPSYIHQEVIKELVLTDLYDSNQNLLEKVSSRFLGKLSDHYFRHEEVSSINEYGKQNGIRRLHPIGQEKNTKYKKG